MTDQNSNKTPINTDDKTANPSLSFKNRIDLTNLQQSYSSIKKELSKVIIGQSDFVELLMVALLTDGHVLIEGVPGIAKTITAKLFAKTLQTDFSRIQFTPDLMPSDVLGTSIVDLKTSEFVFKKGPVFSNIILIDEINRAPAKTQAALFEVMEEKQITMDGVRYVMEPPFMVLATQNPIEQEGTYTLPEAQLDRFLFKIKVTYPTFADEVEILKLHHERTVKDPLELIDAVLDIDKLLEYRDKVQQVFIEEKLLQYIAEIVTKTRSHPHLYLGGSPRASIAIMKSAKAFAAIDGRDFATPEDIKKSVAPVMRHRVIVSPEREMEGMTEEKVMQLILQSIEIPR
ncbi:AAA family ATPase [Aquimarina intermedia]|uniref:MoxR-like ATPase n=1 Tax=Aquimarina intermedia TaxID=350814 RepID=A0A5S5C2F7_9FLAO|nr:MoxR family ATPase [Aquimarina intermedia]TYP72788.1 MoxR-like ATPase [Aquimarina intermedia]